MAKLIHYTAEEAEQVKKQKENRRQEKEIIRKRKKEYGSVGRQLENIIEAINDGKAPAEALQDEAQRVQAIKDKHPKS